MSDFASLLGNLQKSVNKKKEAESISNRNSTSSSSSIRKRPTANDRTDADRPSNQSKRQRKDLTYHGPPSDLHQLSITLSFLCIGAQKAGTSWLHKMLTKHPNLSLPRQKEIHFWDWNRSKGLAWYSKQFPSTFTPPSEISSSSSHYLGEITPCYVVLPEEAISEVKTLFPNVRVFFIARNLVDRAWSALVMELRNSVRGIPVGQFAKHDDTLDPKVNRKYEEEANPERYNDEYFMERLKLKMHTERSDYATHVRQWLKYFDKEQMLIVDYRDIERQPKPFLEQLCQHIQVPYTEYMESLTKEELETRVNEAVGSSKCALRPSLRQKMEEYLKSFTDDFNVLLEELGYSWKL